MGSVWKIGASFLPIKTYDTRSDRVPICTRLMIYSPSQAEIFMLTLNLLQNGAEDGSNQVSATLQIQVDGSWRSLITTDDWITTKSTVFYLEMSYDATSADNKVSCKVIGNEGTILEKTSPALKQIATYAPNACVAGFGTYAACTEFFYWRIESNASQSVVFPKAN